MLKSCLKPFQNLLSNSSVSDTRDPLVWHREFEENASGHHISIAVVQGNGSMEDQSQVISSTLGTYIGVYDGHGGSQASRFVSNHLFPHVQRFAMEQGGMSAEVLRKSFIATEEEFLHLVTRSWLTQPQIASVGSCCLVGVISNNVLYVANLGDSRAILGSSTKAKNSIRAERLSTEHNAAVEEVRKELKSLHPDDSHIVVCRHGVWRVKGIIQVSRSIGDIYFKKPEFSRDPMFTHLGFPVRLQRPILSAEPSIHIRHLNSENEFLIFASDGLWEHIDDQEAAEIVHNNPRKGIAKRLVRAALHKSARKQGIRYAELQKIQVGVRRRIHDDITVIVVYLNQHSINREIKDPPNQHDVGVDCISAPADLFSSDGVGWMGPPD